MYFNKDWKFYYGECENGDYRGFDDSAFKAVTLPHDWSVEHDFDTGGMVGNGKLFIMLFSMIFVGEFAHFQTDAFQKTLGHYLGIVVHVYQLIFDGRTAAIQNQNLHFSFLPPLCQQSN